MATEERMPAIPADKMTADQKKAADVFLVDRGQPVLGPFAVMLRSPEVMLRVKAVGDYLRFRNVLPKRVSEMVILMVAREWTQQFEWTHHYKFAMEAGLKPEVADAIADGRRPARLADDEAAAYDFTLELQRTKRVSDPTYAHARELFGEQGVIDLTGLSGYYSLLAMMMNVARTKADPGHAPLLRLFPD